MPALPSFDEIDRIATAGALRELIAGLLRKQAALPSDDGGIDIVVGYAEECLLQMEREECPGTPLRSRPGTITA